MGLEQSCDDFAFINSLPGKKIILKGNHDYWWTTVTKIRQFFDNHNFRNIEILNNNCFFYNGYAICGTRGWFYEEENGQYSVFVPDLNNASTYGNSLDYAIGMAEELIAGNVL